MSSLRSTTVPPPLVEERSIGGIDAQRCPETARVRRRRRGSGEFSKPRCGEYSTPADTHSTVNRWVLAYAPLIERRLRPFRKPHCGSVRVDETYVRIRGEWRYLYRAIDKHGEAVDFLLTARRDLDAAKRFFRKMLKDGPLLSPDRIGTDGAGTYPGAIAAARKEGRLARDPVHHVTKHLQQGIESDHFRLKKNMPRVGGFRSFNTARRSIQGFEAMLWMRKGFGFSGPWTVIEQNRMLGLCFGLSKVNEA